MKSRFVRQVRKGKRSPGRDCGETCVCHASRDLALECLEESHQASDVLYAPTVLVCATDRPPSIHATGETGPTQGNEQSSIEPASERQEREEKEREQSTTHQSSRSLCTGL